MTRFLVTGAGGMLGRDLLAALADAKVTALTRAELDITDAGAVHEAVAGHDIVLNAAAWTDVDGAETREAEATAVNGDGVAHLARACAASGARLLHVSTDYVFPGNASSPYPEDAPTDPINAYGRSKLVGEQAVLAAGGYVVRTAWLYGAHGRNFVSTMLRLAGEREHLDVVDDQRGQPTWSHALATRLVALGVSDSPPGVYHGTASGETTWYGLARAVFELSGLDPDRISPTTSDKYPRPAPRPAYSVLGHARWSLAGLPPMTDWKAMLTSYLEGSRV
ncbi:dTDP-4-dehydrorhamnose reductase [Micromonospora sp. CPCC 205371]|nr:dTDP-4-dehydrorhamnose reductase [Micromonospora sp. CPCC 205371]